MKGSQIVVEIQDEDDESSKMDLSDPSKLSPHGDDSKKNKASAAEKLVQIRKGRSDQIKQLQHSHSMPENADWEGTWKGTMKVKRDVDRVLKTMETSPKKNEPEHEVAPPPPKPKHEFMRIATVPVLHATSSLGNLGSSEFWQSAKNRGDDRRTTEAMIPGMKTKIFKHSKQEDEILQQPTQVNVHELLTPMNPKEEKVREVLEKRHSLADAVVKRLVEKQSKKEETIPVLTTYSLKTPRENFGLLREIMVRKSRGAPEQEESDHARRNSDFSATTMNLAILMGGMNSENDPVGLDWEELANLIH
eukprot:c13114_g1_i1.p1 GENE.c13114_g1_i1~~c13114_g1_i1.p1  ORF type:complete len:305 (-),score=143.24 c13114_g1_i1:85-999(-)